MDIQKAAQSLIGRDVKKRFRRYVNNGSGGWFSGIIASYDEDTNLFLVVFEDGDRKVYDLNPNNDNIQVCPLHMCYDPSARLSMSSEDEGKRIQVFHAKDQQWIGGWVEAYDNVEGAHVIRFDDEDDRTGGQSPHFEGNLIIVDFNKAVQYRLLKDAEHADLRREERGLNKDTGKMQGHEENQVAAKPSYVVRPKASANGPSTFLLANIETFLRDSGYVKIFRRLRALSASLTRPPFTNVCNIFTCISACRNVLLPTEAVLGRMSELLRETAFEYALSLSDNELRRAARERLESSLFSPVRLMLEAAARRLSAREKRKCVRRRSRRQRQQDNGAGEGSKVVGLEEMIATVTQSSSLLVWR